MTTVNKQPVQPKTVTGNSIPAIVNVKGNDYSRPTAGGNATGDNVPASAGVTPGPDAYRPNLAGNAFPNPTIDGAAIVAPVARPDATGAPESATDGGTVGTSKP